MRFVESIFSERVGAMNIHSSVMAAVDRNPHPGENNMMAEGLESATRGPDNAWPSTGIGASGFGYRAIAEQPLKGF